MDLIWIASRSAHFAKPHCRPLTDSPRQATFLETKKTALTCHLSSERLGSSHPITPKTHTRHQERTAQQKANKSATRRSHQSLVIVPHERPMCSCWVIFAFTRRKVSFIYPLRYYTRRSHPCQQTARQDATHTSERGERSYLVGTYFGNKR